jgi:predicted kinase
MQAVIFVGLQGAGKSEFFHRRFFDTHVRINLDMLKTRNRENVLFRACLEARQPFVVDNTNVTRDDRRRYIPQSRQAGFRVIAYYFQSLVDACRQRNAQRPEGRRVPDGAIFAAQARLQIPTTEEGFDAVYYVSIAPNGDFLVDDPPQPP